MNKTSKDSKKKKVKLSTSKLIFCETFIRNGIFHAFIQCESRETFIGVMEKQFQVIWSGNIKQRVTCLAYCKQLQILYAGSLKGAIAYICFKEQKDQETQKIGRIDPINGQNILAMFTYYDDKDGENVLHLFAVNSEGIIRKYSNNKYNLSINLPFKVEKAIANKSIINVKDIAFAFLTLNSNFPYLFTQQYIINICNSALSKQEMSKEIQKYNLSMPYQEDEKSNSNLSLVQPQKIKSIALSNSKKLMAISQGAKIRIYQLQKISIQNQFIKMVPQFELEESEEILNIDIRDNDIVIITNEGLLAFNALTHKKIIKISSKSKSLQCNLVKWIDDKQITYGSTRAQKFKLTSYQLNSKQ